MPSGTFRVCGGRLGSGYIEVWAVGGSGATSVQPGRVNGGRYSWDWPWPPGWEGSTFQKLSRIAGPMWLSRGVAVGTACGLRCGRVLMRQALHCELPPCPVRRLGVGAAGVVLPKMHLYGSQHETAWQGCIRGKMLARFLTARCMGVRKFPAISTMSRAGVAQLCAAGTLWRCGSEGRRESQATYYRGDSAAVIKEDPKWTDGPG